MFNRKQSFFGELSFQMIDKKIIIIYYLTYNVFKLTGEKTECIILLLTPNQVPGKVSAFGGRLKTNWKKETYPFLHI